MQETACDLINVFVLFQIFKPILVDLEDKLETVFQDIFLIDNSVFFFLQHPWVQYKDRLYLKTM